MKWSLPSALIAATVIASTSSGYAQGYNVGGSEDRPRQQNSTPSSGNATVSNSTGSIQPTTGTARVTPAGTRRDREWWEYAGVTPGGNEMTVLRRWARGRRNRPAVAWPGFQMTQQGSRVFLAVTHNAAFTPVNEPGRLVYRVANAVIPLSNNRRALETGAFNTPVTRAFLRSHGRDAELVIELRANSLPNVSQQNGPEGVTFVMLDFPQWTPPNEPATAGPRTASTTSSEPATPPRTATANGPGSNGSSNEPVPANMRATGTDTERPTPIRVQKHSTP